MKVVVDAAAEAGQEQVSPCRRILAPLPRISVNKAIVDSGLHPRCTAHDELNSIGVDAAVFAVMLSPLWNTHDAPYSPLCKNATSHTKPAVMLGLGLRPLIAGLGLGGCGIGLGLESHGLGLGGCGLGLDMCGLVNITDSTIGR